LFAIQALKSFGPEAHDAVPELMNQLNDINFDVRFAAEQTLDVIQGRNRSGPTIPGQTGVGQKEKKR
jgi:hypothetical protein